MSLSCYQGLVLRGLRILSHFPVSLHGRGWEWVDRESKKAGASGAEEEKAAPGTLGDLIKEKLGSKLGDLK